MGKTDGRQIETIHPIPSRAYRSCTARTRVCCAKKLCRPRGIGDFGDNPMNQTRVMAQLANIWSATSLRRKDKNGWFVPVPSGSRSQTVPSPRWSESWRRAARGTATSERLLDRRVEERRWIRRYFIARDFDLNFKGISGLRRITPYRLLKFSYQLVSGVNVPNMSHAQHRIEAVPMADETIASIIPLHQPKRPRPVPNAPAPTGSANGKRRRPLPRQMTSLDLPKSLIPEGFSSADPAFAEPAIAPPPTVTLRAVARDEDARSRSIPPILLRAAALVLAGVGIAMNGWFARSLGASDAAGWLFFATGVASDLVALVVPSCAARLWQARHRATSLAGWAVWAMTFVFAVTAGVGFASTNIADVTLARASRVTPAVAAAQAALSDAMSARDRECKGGVGKFCRERELAVNERRQALDTAMQAVGQTADPQTDAAIRIVAWATHGRYNPPAMTSQCCGLSCWRYCRRSVAYCSWSGDRRNEPSLVPTTTVLFG